MRRKEPLARGMEELNLPRPVSLKPTMSPTRSNTPNAAARDRSVPSWITYHSCKDLPSANSNMDVACMTRKERGNRQLNRVTKRFKTAHFPKIWAYCCAASFSAAVWEFPDLTNFLASQSLYAGQIRYEKYIEE